jgi:hypothetical protein
VNRRRISVGTSLRTGSRSDPRFYFMACFRYPVSLVKRKR